MFILGEDTATQAAELVQFEERGMVGEAEELAAMSIELVEGYASLEMAFARLEAKAIREQATEGALSEDTQTLIEEASKSFFKRAVEKIKEYWNKFVDFIKKAVDRVLNFLSSQEKFVKKNEDALKGIKDEQLKEVKFNRTEIVADPSIINGILDGAVSVAKEATDKAQKETTKSFKRYDFDKKAASAMKLSGDAKESLSARISKTVTGVKDKDAVMTTKDIENSLTVLREAAKVKATASDAQTAASNAIKVAEAQAKMGDKKEGAQKSQEAQEALKNLQSVSSRIGGVFTAATRAAASGASNAKSVLSKALSGTGTRAKQEETTVTEGTDPLEQYLV